MSGDHLHVFGRRPRLGTVRSFAVSSAPATGAERQRVAVGQITALVRELGERLSPAQAQILDESLQILATEDSVRPSERDRALQMIVQVAADAGAPGSPLLDLIDRVLTGPAPPVTAAPADGEEAKKSRHFLERRLGERERFARLWDTEPGSSEYAELRGRLVQTHLPLVERLAERLARRYHNRKTPLDDLVQAGTEGLLKAVDRFDPDRGRVEFSAYATGLIGAEMRRYLRDQGMTVPHSRELRELRLALFTATTELSRRHGRSPTVRELAERLAVSEQEVLEGLESAGADAAFSLDVHDPQDRSPAAAADSRTHDAASGRLREKLLQDVASSRLRSESCVAVLNLLDEEPRVGTPVRLTVELVAGAGHPWAGRGERPLLEIVAVPLSGAEVEPATVVYRPGQRVSGEFRVTAREPGAHPVRFTFVHHGTGAVLQQVVADLEVGHAARPEARS